MKRIMGIDIGEKRIGIAISDPLGFTAQGVETYVRKGEGDAQYILDRARSLGAELLVAGLPLNMNGTEGPSAQKAREFVSEVNALGLPSAFVDERLTTISAERMLIDADVSRKKRRQVIDKVAAVYILRTYLDTHKL